MKKDRTKIEFRNHVMPVKSPMIALLGKKWTMTYEDGADHLHYHNYFEIGFCNFGQGTIRIGEEQLRFSGGEFTVIPPGIVHSTNSDPNTNSAWEYLIVDMEKIFQEKHEKNADLTEHMLRRLNTRAFMGMAGGEYERIAYIIREILDVFRRTEEFYYEEARGLLDALIVNLVRVNKEENDSYNKNGQKMAFDMACIIDYINEHYMEELRVTSLAEKYHFSETHFRRVFRTHMGMGPLEYVNKVRVHAACEYLRTTDKSVVDISSLCGFSNLSTFNRNFSHITGKTPYQWRKETQNMSSIKRNE